ncbi:MAG: hypothetical protein P8181_12885 [bacterium]
MKAKQITAWTFALAAIGLAVAVVWVRMAANAGLETRTVVLAKGETVSGLLLSLNEQRLVLQTEDRTWIVGANDIRQVDGKPVRECIPVTGNVVVVQETFEDVLPNGEIDVHSSKRLRNNSRTPIRELKWGIAPHELKYLESIRMLDQFGNSMPVRVVDDLANGGKRVKVTLIRPVFPGEEAWYTSRFLETQGTFRDGDVWVYRNVGDYPEHRLVTRSVRLPEGADVMSISPEPLHREMVDGRLLVVWRRFFMGGDRVPWEIRYRL